MRSVRTILPVIGIATLLAGAALFQQAAPDRYGLPEIEVLEPGPTGQRIDQDELFGNIPLDVLFSEVTSSSYNISSCGHPKMVIKVYQMA